MSWLELSARLHYPSGFVLDLAFQAGDGVTALLGPSGSGKTTTLSIIAGLRTPQAGRIRLGDTVLFDSTAGVDLAPEARRIGYVFQEHLLFPHLTVRDNILYGRKRRQESARRIDAEHVIGVLDLSALLGRKPATLSGGQRQRVALARALLCSPDLLLLDEPLASLDEDLKEQVLGYIEKVVAESHIPTLYVSHDSAEVRRLCAQTVELRNGCLATGRK